MLPHIHTHTRQAATVKQSTATWWTHDTGSCFHYAIFWAILQMQEKHQQTQGHHSQKGSNIQTGHFDRLHMFPYLQIFDQL